MPLAAVVSDDTEFVIQVSHILDGRGWATLTTRESTALASIKRERPDLIIFDVRGDRPEPSWSLLDLLRREQATSQVPVLVSSRDAGELLRNPARLEDLHAVPLSRPFDSEQFGAVMDGLVSV
jgi:CheY-like chemotaxis protein